MIIPDDRGLCEPTTFRDRVAFALCAHDVQNCEGRMNDEELADLERLMVLARGIHGTKTRQMFRHLTAFISMERAFRETEGNAVMHAHIIRADWPSYLRAADAAIAVLMERPEGAQAIVADAAAKGGGNG